MGVEEGGLVLCAKEHLDGVTLIFATRNYSGLGHKQVSKHGRKVFVMALSSGGRKTHLLSHVPVSTH